MLLPYSYFMYNVKNIKGLNYEKRVDFITIFFIFIM
jgi:hypothetical protein